VEDADFGLTPTDMLRLKSFGLLLKCGDTLRANLVGDLSCKQGCAPRNPGTMHRKSGY
jgi:hypothetical protein